MNLAHQPHATTPRRGSPRLGGFPQRICCLLVGLAAGVALAAPGLAAADPVAPAFTAQVNEKLQHAEKASVRALRIDSVRCVPGRSTSYTCLGVIRLGRRPLYRVRATVNWTLYGGAVIVRMAVGGMMRRQAPPSGLPPAVADQGPMLPASPPPPFVSSR